MTVENECTRARAAPAIYPFVLIRCHGNELGLWKDEYVDVIERGHRQFRVTIGCIDRLNDMETRNVFMHGI